MNEYNVVLSKAYSFEGNEYTEVDLSGLNDLTTENLCAAQKMLDKGMGTVVMPEFSMEYACIICHLATKLPLEFFKGLPGKDGIKFKNQVTKYFFGQDSEE